MAKVSEKSGQLAERLAKILVKLNNGASLDIKNLADEFKVSERTIIRDIGRLQAAHLPLKQNEQQKYYLDQHYLSRFDVNDMKAFAKVSGVVDLYPPLDDGFLNELLASREQSVYVAKGYTHEDASKFKKLLSMFSEAIENNQQIAFIYKDEPRVVEPYRLIHHHGSWYLAAVRKGELRTYRVSRISRSYQQHKLAKFEPDHKIIEQLESEKSIWFGQEKIKVRLKIHADVISHFKQRKLLPEQDDNPIEREDGGWDISCKISHAMQLLPLVRYWIPHVEIISPDYLQAELEAGLKGYLGR